jgi:hypothetical protein
MKRWMIVGFAAGAALFGCPLVLVAAMQVDEPRDDWVLAVERYANRHARPEVNAPTGADLGGGEPELVRGVPDPRDLLRLLLLPGSVRAGRARDRR